MTDDAIEGGGFLERWSRRKRRVEWDDPEAREVAPPEATEPLENQPAEAETDEAILARLELPDPDTLVAGDDFSRYLKAPLPRHLKQRALRRLWRSNPVLANLDGLNDYDTDFTGDSVPLGTLKTAYEVGRGFAARTLEIKSEEADARSAPVEDAPPGDDPETGELEDAGLDLQKPRETAFELTDIEPELPTPSRNRRMSFRFET